MQYKANNDIALAQTRIRFDVRGQCVDTPARVILRMMPSPRLVIKCDWDLRNSDIGPADFQQDYVTATVHDQETELIVGQFTFHWDPENIQADMSLFPKRGPISIHHTGESLASVEFGVLNFPEFWGEQDKTIQSNDNSYRRFGAMKLQADPWTVDITAAPNLSDVKKELAATGGYGVTHSGTIRRTDGNEFRASDTEYLLGGLSLFLSFARGAYCGFTLVQGKSRDGQVPWELWGTQSVTGWFSPPSWFDRHHGHLLAEVFPGFWQLYKRQEKDLRVIVTFYLDSNLGSSHGVGQDGGLILTQAALERMAHERVGEQAKRKIGTWIAKGLEENGISEKTLPIPPDSCPELAMLAAKHDWKHGPHALVEIRNNVVHPKQKYGKMSARAYYEAWNLGQWYLELMLLRLFGASRDFDYGNRLKKRWVGEVEHLGQWLVENMPRGTDLELPNRDEPEREIPLVGANRTVPTCLSHTRAHSP